MNIVILHVMMPSIKKLVWILADLVGVPYLLLYLRRNDATILLYHGVFPNQPQPGIFNYRKKFITPEAFEKQLMWLRKHCTLLDLPTLIELQNRRERFPPRACAITFDDGYENNYRFAFPILKRLGIPATIFITTDLVEKKEPLWVDRLEYAIGTTDKQSLSLVLEGESKNFSLATKDDRILADDWLRTYMKKIPNEEAKSLLTRVEEICEKKLGVVLSETRYRGLTWDEVKEMQQHGITFAAHTCSHPILSRVSTENARQEIEDSHQVLKQHEINPLPIFAYPNGGMDDFNEATISILKEAGFTASLTTTPKKLRTGEDLFRIGRISLDGTDGMYFFRVTVSGARALLRRFFRFIPTPS